jgi:hypothetical protein
MVTRQTETEAPKRIVPTLANLDVAAARAMAAARAVSARGPTATAWTKADMMPPSSVRAPAKGVIPGMHRATPIVDPTCQPRFLNRPRDTMIGLF